MRWTIAVGSNLWKNLKLAVGQLYVPWCEYELHHCPSKFYFWIQQLLFFYEDRENPKMRLMMMVLSLNVLHALFLGRKSYPKIWRPQRTQVWPVVVIGHHLGPRSFKANHSSFDQVCGFCAGMYTGLLAFRWIQKWLQGIQGPCGSFRKFSIKINFTLKPPIPRSPCLDSDPMHAQGLRRDKIRDFALVYLFFEWQMSGVSAPNSTDIDFASFEDPFSSWTCVHSCLTCVRVRKECSVGKTLCAYKYWLCCLLGGVLAARMPLSHFHCDTHIHTHTHAHTYTHTRTHTYTYTHIHTHWHTHVHSLPDFASFLLTLNSCSRSDRPPCCVICLISVRCASTSLITKPV